MKQDSFLSSPSIARRQSDTHIPHDYDSTTTCRFARATPVVSSVATNVASRQHLVKSILADDGSGGEGSRDSDIHHPLSPPLASTMRPARCRAADKTIDILIPCGTYYTRAVACLETFSWSENSHNS